MARQVDFLLVGGGLASATAAETLRLEGATGSILILSAEDIPPYHRPPLSKGYLLGNMEEQLLFVHPPSFYQLHAIELGLNCPVISIDPAQNEVTIANGETIGYGQLLLATGTAPKPLSVKGERLRGIYSLRSKQDCEAIRRKAKSGKRAVVLGGSFLGMEVAMSLRDLGMEVTIIERGGVLMPHLAAPTVAEYFRQHSEEKGAQILLCDTAVAFHGSGGQVHEVETESGRRLPCDLAVISIGVAPATGFLAGSGLALDRQGRILVDDQLRTDIPNIFAAGDAASFYDPVFAERRHIEHWDNAVKQGRLAARNMLGQRLRYDEISYFFCEIGDLSFSMLGMPEKAGRRISRGTLDSRSFALFYLRNEIPRALFSLGRPVEETRAAEALIRYRVTAHDIEEKLADDAFPLDRLATQTVLILQGGGALGAFECGVVKALEEERIFPDIVAGVSIGALNGAIIAGNPRQATEALESFWADLAVASPNFPFADPHHSATSMQILAFGVPNFFTPRWMSPFEGLQAQNWTSFYDTAPMRKLIARYVDFSALKTSPVRLLVSAVNVTTAKLEIFDSYVDDLTPDHLLASGSLPPGFPWTMVNGQAYWDGGIVNNSPLDIVVDRCGPHGKNVYIVDLFSDAKPLPKTMMEVMARRDEILYSERIRNDLLFRETTVGYRKLIDEILSYVAPEARARIKQRPRYIELMGDGAPMNITRFVRTGCSDESASRDYDFSDVSIRLNQTEGYDLVKRTLKF